MYANANKVFKCDPFRQQRCLPLIMPSDRPLQPGRAEREESSGEKIRVLAYNSQHKETQWD